MDQINYNDIVEYVTGILKKNRQDIKSYLFENVNILNEIENPTVNIIYALSLLQNEKEFIYIAPEVVNTFVVSIAKCVFLKNHNVENSLWLNYF